MSGKQCGMKVSFNFDSFYSNAEIKKIATNYIQKPVVIGCFGVMDGSRDQFKKVIIAINRSKYFFSFENALLHLKIWLLSFKSIIISDSNESFNQSEFEMNIDLNMRPNWRFNFQ